MNCDATQLERYHDGALTAEAGAAIEQHLAGCAACRARLDGLEGLAAALAQPQQAAVPDGLWTAIAERLDAPGAAAPRHAGSTLFKRWSLIAASVAAAVGLGLAFAVWSPGNSQANAATIDFSVMLDTLHIDPQAAFGKFLRRHHGRQVRRTQAHAEAPDLNFAIPPRLVSGYVLDSVYVLRFGPNPGIAATYRQERTGQFLVTLFHTPVHPDDYGTHRDYDCVVGNHHGHTVQVGDWKMVHLTDPTTCHCVLSTLNDTAELPAVMAAIAPALE